MSDQPIESLSFEQAQRELEQIVAQLESGRASLEDTVALWERGELLYRHCLARLEAAEGRVEELARQAQPADGGGQAEPAAPGDPLA